MRQRNREIPRGYDKDTRALLKKARATPGSDLDCRRSGHWQWFAPDGQNIVNGGGTPGDRKAIRSARARIRRLGGYTYVGLDQF